MWAECAKQQIFFPLKSLDQIGTLNKIKYPSHQGQLEPETTLITLSQFKSKLYF